MLVMETTDVNPTAIVTELLKRRDRTLTAEQMTVVLQAVSPEPTILYITLALEVISTWKSSDRDRTLQPTVTRLIEQIFDSFELTYGKQFVSMAFALITFAREGINDIEMQDLLSLHEEVLAEVFQYSNLHCFPMHVWLRLRFALKEMTREKERHCIQWYHRQLQEVAAVRYAPVEQQCHELMGRYFSNLVDEKTVREKMIHKQYLTDNFSVWFEGCLVNRRRVIEGYYHLLQAQLFEAAMQEICSFEFICAACLCGDIFQVVRALETLVDLYSASATEEVSRKLRHFHRWISKAAPWINTDPVLYTRIAAGGEPLESEVRKAVWSSIKGDPWSWDACSVLSMNCYRRFDPIEVEFAGNSSPTWSPDSRMVAYGNDGNLMIRDATSGKLVDSYEDSAGKVNLVRWNPANSSQLATTTDTTIRIWEALTGVIVQTLAGHPKQVKAIDWSHDGQRLASISKDGSLRIWNSSTGEELHAITVEYSFELTAMCWSHDDQTVAVGTDGKPYGDGCIGMNITLWNSTTGEKIPEFKHNADHHTGFISCLTWSDDDRLLISGSADESVGVWNVSTGARLWNLVVKSSYSLDRDGSVVMSVLWQGATQQIVAVFKDCVRIWDNTTGALVKAIPFPHYLISFVWNADRSRCLLGDGKRLQVMRADQLYEMEVSERVSGDGTLVWSVDESLIVTAESERLSLWDGKTGGLIRSKLVNQDSRLKFRNIISATITKDNAKIFTVSKNQMEVFDEQTLESLFCHYYRSDSRYDPEFDWMCSRKNIAWNGENNTFAMTTVKKEVEIWAIEKAEILHTYRYCDLGGGNSENEPVGMIWAPDGKQLAINFGKNGIVIVTPTDSSPTQQKTLKVSEVAVSVMNWSLDSEYLVCADPSEIILFDVVRNRKVVSWKTKQKPTSLAFNNDESRIVSCAGNEIHVWSRYGGLCGTFRNDNWVSLVAWNHAGTGILSYSSNSIRIWYC